MYKTKNKLLFSLTILLTILISGCSSKPSFAPETLSLLTPRFGHAAVNDGKKIYVLAGANGSGFLSDIEIIDPISGKTKVLPDLLIPRRYFSTVWDGAHSIYIIGGVSLVDNKFRYEHRVEVFDTLTHEVAFAKPLPGPTRINSAVFLEGRIFVFGGAYPTKEKLTASALVGVFDTNLDKWLRAANMPTAKTTRAVARDGLIYVIGGYDRTSSLDVFERFDPKTNKWQSLPPMPDKISAHSVTLIKDKLYTFGDYNNLTSTYCYDFATSQWQKVNLDYKASRHNAVTTLNGITYVIGGNAGSAGPFLDYIQTFKL